MNEDLLCNVTSTAKTSWFSLLKQNLCIVGEGRERLSSEPSGLTSNNDFWFSQVTETNVPEYTLQGIWWLTWLVALEYLALWWQGTRLPDLHENILSLVHAALYEVSKLLVRGLEYYVYVWVWNHHAFLPAPDDTFFSLILVIVLVDFGFYWMHRASHEIMVLWTIHQVHHSSEEFSLAVGLRHSPLQRLFSWVFYLPLAFLGIPPGYMLAHIQFNLLFQCWTHTEAIRTVGPLEYLFNTPSHHRVHHGCNIYCLDKNYGGIFIIWDRLFGTFQPERQNEGIAYGIVFQPQRFNPLYHQVFYMIGAMKKAQSMTSWGDSLMSLIKGPSWVPGAPWTGWEHDKLDIKGPRDHLPISAVAATHCYVLVHFLAALSLTSYLTYNSIMSPWASLLYAVIVIATLTSIGVLYENSPFCSRIEICRCCASLAICLLIPLSHQFMLKVIITIYVISVPIWIFIPEKLIG